MRYDRPGWFTRERLLTFALLAATAVAIYFCYLLIRPFFPALAWATAFAVVAYPLHTRICRRIRNRNVASLLSVAIVAIALAGPVVFVTRQLVKEAANGAELIQQETKNGRWRTSMRQNPYTARILRFAEANLDLDDAFKRLSGGLADAGKRAVGSSFWAIVQLAIAMFALFYIFRDHDAVLHGVRSMLPLSESETDAVVQRVSDTIYAALFGMVAVAAVQGTLGGIVLAILGIPAPVVWGFVMFLLAVVPVLGTPVVWIPIAVYLAIQGSWGKAIFLAAYGMTVIGLIDNVLYPLLVGHRMRLHPLPVFFAIIGGISVFGASGIVLGPVVLALTVALFDIWRRRTAAGHSAEAELQGQVT